MCVLTNFHSLKEFVQTVYTGYVPMRAMKNSKLIKPHINVLISVTNSHLDGWHFV